MHFGSEINWYVKMHAYTDNCRVFTQRNECKQLYKKCNTVQEVKKKENCTRLHLHRIKVMIVNSDRTPGMKKRGQILQRLMLFSGIFHSHKSDFLFFQIRYLGLTVRHPSFEPSTSVQTVL